jgi:2-amino-4-hydroxy-6-hydroxymethyldihydropteridine diphosphokinase
MESVTAYLGLGSNVGDSLAALRAACSEINALPKTKITAYSSVYRTEPVGFKDQPDFLNCAVEISTQLPPDELMTAVKNIEQTLGRKKREQWHEREIDIDILLYGNTIAKNERYEIPHPRMHERKFVLVPLAEISQHAVHPPTGKTAGELLKNLSSNDTVELAYEPSSLTSLTEP